MTNEKYSDEPVSGKRELDLYGQPRNFTANLHHYDLEVGMNVESGEIEVIYFSTPSHNLVLIWENKPKSNVSILFAQDVNEDEVILFNQSTEYLEAFGITTDNYSREFEQLPAYNY